MDIKVMFVIPKDAADESGCTKDMSNCFELCRKHGIESFWIKETQCGDFAWKKRDVIIFQSFEGDAFKKLSTSKRVVLGPRCLQACLVQNKSIPNTSSPIYTIGMMDFVVTSSGVSIDRKKQIKEKVEYMGAVYDFVLSTRTTHLITNSVKTDKYIKASEIKIPVMLDVWVEAVWRENLTNIVAGDSKKFDRYRCPVFHNLCVTSTGFVKERKEIADLVNNNGGIYSGKFKSESTSILIYRDTQTEKFKTALKSNVDCVTIDWLKDSVKCGYALLIDKYKYKKNLSSMLINPVDSDNGLEFSLTRSRTVSETNKSVKSVSETHVNFTDLSIVPQEQSRMKELQGTPLNHIVDSIDMKQVKEAGIFLDGCTVFLSGFTDQSRDKLCKVLNSSGATRYDVISDRVTHVILGNEKSSDMVQFETSGLNLTIVSVDWLIESIRLKHVAPKFKFNVSCNQQETLPIDLLVSPLSRKGVQLLCKKRKIQETSSNLNDNSMKIDVMQQYLTINEGNTGDTLNKFLVKGDFQTATTTTELNSNNQNNNTTIKFDDEATLENEKRPEQKDDNVNLGIENIDENSETNILNSMSCHKLFSGLTFFLLNWDNNDDKTKLIELIECQGGKIVPDRDSCDYVVTVYSIPLTDFDERFINELWLEECAFLDLKIPISYYHRPVKIRSGAKPLVGLVICISKYFTYERIFLQWLVNHLGAISQDQLARKGTIQKNGVIPSTHLLCPEPSGTKYVAAKKWGIHVVTCDWIIACEEQQAYVPEGNYAIEQSIEKTGIVVPGEVKSSAVSAIIEIPKKKIKLESREGVRTPTSSCEETPSRSSVQVTPSNFIISKQLQELKDILTKSEGKKCCRRSLIRNDPALTNQFFEDIAINERNDIYPSQTDTIGWEEPFENEVNVKIAEREQTRYKFMLSQISMDNRNNSIKKIQSLGGSISDTPNFFDDTATHLLCNVLSRNEKLLSSIASGKWILHLAFLDHCIESGRFIDEEMFEYGNPFALPIVQKLSEGNTALLVTAAYRWRKRIIETGKKAYDGMRAIILIGANRKDQIRRLIEAGGGTVVDPAPPYTDIRGATHCFIEGKCLSEYPNVEEIAKQGVPCLPHVYLNNYLLMDPQPDPLKCVLEPFQGFYKHF